MPFTGDTFTKLFSWLTDQQRNKKIFDARLDAEFEGIATGLSEVAARTTVVEGDVSDLEGVAVTADSAFGTDNLLLRSDGTDRKAQSSPVVVADTTGALSRSGNGGIPVQGTNTNDSATTGDVGEYVSSAVGSGSAVSLTSNTPANITTISLTAGDWDVWGNIYFSNNATPSITATEAGWNTTTATLPSRGTGRSFLFLNAFTNGQDLNLGTQPVRLSIASTTTVYLVARATFAGGTAAAYGTLAARRSR